MKDKTILDVEMDILAVNKELKKVKGYISDDKIINMDIEFAKIDLLKKKFYLLSELSDLLRDVRP